MNPNQIIQGDALTWLRELESESVDCCITSPPYWALRDYKTPGQLGLEPTFTEYIQKLVEIFAQVKRILKKTGSCWVNLGDTYNGTKVGNDSGRPREGNFHGGSYKANTKSFKKQTEKTIPEKSLCLIPQRFQIAMVDQEWICRNTIIWYKPNCMPSSARDRFTIDFEYLFFFTRSQRYYFDTQYEPLDTPISGGAKQRGNGQGSGIKFGGNKAEGYGPATYSGNEWEPTEVIDEATRKNAIARGWNPKTHSYADWYFNLREKKSWHNHEYDLLMGNGQQKRGEKFQKLNYPYGRIKRCVWRIPTAPFPEAHFATFPPALVETPIKATCPVEGLVLDPFCGAGTVPLVAMQNARNFIGIELNQNYIDMAQARLKPYLLQTRLPI